NRYARIRDLVRDQNPLFSRLDAGQLFKHAFALRTAVQKRRHKRKKAILFFLYAEPDCLVDGRPIPIADIEQHDSEVHRFSEEFEGDEVSFCFCTYRKLLASWAASDRIAVRSHAAALTNRFRV